MRTIRTSFSIEFLQSNRNAKEGSPSLFYLTKIIDRSIIYCAWRRFAIYADQTEEEQESPSKRRPSNRRERRMKIKKIGTLTYPNPTQDVACSSFLCLKGVNESEGGFACYKAERGVQLAGIINCSGCPTAVVPEKLLGRVRSLTELGVDAIHLSACMLALCPFKNKYLKILRERFPGIEFVEGTHRGPPGVTPEMFIETMKRMLTQPRQTMADVAKVITNQMSITSNL